MLQRKPRDEVRDLVFLARKGDHAAYSEIVDRYKESLYRLALRLLKRPDESEDALQEAFIKAYVHLDSYDDRYSFYTWISTIVTNVCYSTMRTRDWRVGTASDQVLYGLKSPDTALHPETAALLKSRDDVLRAAIMSLPEKYARILILRYWNDLTYQEVADLTQQSLGAVKTQIRRATLLLRDSLAGQHADLLPEHA